MRKIPTCAENLPTDPVDRLIVQVMRRGNLSDRNICSITGITYDELDARIAALEKLYEF